MSEATNVGAVSFDAYSELADFLQDLNYEHECDHATVIAKGIMYAAFCADPIGDWILETGDPRQRLEYIGDDEEATYQPIPLDALKGHSPFTVIAMPTVVAA